MLCVCVCDRNLSVEGGTSVCEKFVADDVMTPLLALCSQVC